MLRIYRMTVLVLFCAALHAELLPCKSDAKTERILWRIVLDKPYDRNLPVLLRTIREDAEEGPITYAVESFKTVLICTGAPYALDVIAESPEVCSIHEVERRASRRWWKPWTWRRR